tara:strand:+ start:105 stop:458 length:354 start_codon:yes stop_codon:yes gene_type:complete
MMELIKIKKINNFKNKLSRKQKNIYFLKKELSLILNLYSKNVSDGVWKDYSLDYNEKYALFCAYRSSFEKPILRIEKNKIPKGFHFTIKKKDKNLYNSSDINKIINHIYKMPKLIIS